MSFLSRLSSWLQYAALRSVAALFELLPRAFALQVGNLLGDVAYVSLRRLRRVGLQNLALAFPNLDEQSRQALLRREYRHLGRQVVEVSRLSHMRKEEAERYIQYDGLERYLAAREKGRGVLVLTAHLGAWEMSSFFHSLQGFPMGMVIRRLDNPWVDRWVNGVRCLHGNRVLAKDDFARALLTEMREGQTVGILMDTNMTPPQGVFVPFFGVQACTGSGLARVARKTGAAVVPGFLLAEAKGTYRLHFGEEIAIVRTEDAEADTVENTRRFTEVLEGYIREHPDQWLWMHRRWKTRPVGEARLYT